MNFRDSESSVVLKVPRQALANYVGDLLITQEGAFGDAPTLFIVSWNGAEFVVRRLPPPPSGDLFEHVTFAPLDLPALNP